MLSNIELALTKVISFVGDVVSSIISADGELNALLPVVCLGIAVSVLTFGIKTIKRLTWGM